MRCFVLLGIVLWQAGCASMGTYNPATGKNEFIFISTDEEVAMGKDVHQQLIKQYEFDLYSSRADKVNRIGQQLAAGSERQDYVYHFYVIKEDEMNAFTVPGGSIYIFSGLLDKLTSDDALASVLAHEIGHCAAKHTVKKYQAALGYNLIGNIVLSQVGESAQQVASMSTGALMNLVFSAYGRQDEYESDMLGLRYMARAGYRLEGMVEAFEVLKKESQGGESTPLILRTHPYLDDRILAVKGEIRNIRNQNNTL